MNWKKWLGFSLYKKLWSLIGKRPWTFIRRDFYHIAPLLNIGFFFWGGVMFGVYHQTVMAWVNSSLWNFFIFTFGVWLIGGIQCHFFWGSKWIKGQKGNG